jgi:hypothetical protein
LVELDGRFVEIKHNSVQTLDPYPPSGQKPELLLMTLIRGAAWLRGVKRRTIRGKTVVEATNAIMDASI